MTSLGCVLSVQQQNYHHNHHLTPNSSPKTESLTVSRSRSLSRRSTPNSLTEGGRSYDGIRAGGSADSGCVTPNEILSGSDLARDKSHSAKIQANNNNTIEVPEYVIDRQTKITYLKGKFLGKVSSLLSHSCHVVDFCPIQVRRRSKRLVKRMLEPSVAGKQRGKK